MRQATHRTLTNIFLTLLLTSQALLPLRYYLGEDEFDERFAWRMFSPVRTISCQVRWLEGEAQAPVRLSAHVQLAWIELMKRARMDVVDGFARDRCAQLASVTSTPQLRARVTCPHPDGTPRTPVTDAENLCETLR